MTVSVSPAAARMRRLRQRRAAERSRLRDTTLVDPGDLLEPAVRKSIGALGLAPQDAGAARVALLYAETIDGLADQAWALRTFGPLLMQALVALHATPMSRARAPGSRTTSPHLKIN